MQKNKKSEKNKKEDVQKKTQGKGMRHTPKREKKIKMYYKNSSSR